MSRIRHRVSVTESDERNACPDENARATNPNSFSRSGSDSRTDSSSSTTDTKGGSMRSLPCGHFMNKTMRHTVSRVHCTLVSVWLKVQQRLGSCSSLWIRSRSEPRNEEVLQHLGLMR